MTILAVNFGLMNMRTSQTKFEVKKNSWQITLDINLHFTTAKDFFALLKVHVCRSSKNVTLKRHFE